MITGLNWVDIIEEEIELLAGCDMRERRNPAFHQKLQSDAQRMKNLLDNDTALIIPNNYSLLRKSYKAIVDVLASIKDREVDSDKLRDYIKTLEVRLEDEKNAKSRPMRSEGGVMLVKADRYFNMGVGKTEIPLVSIAPAPTEKLHNGMDRTLRWAKSWVHRSYRVSSDFWKKEKERIEK
jgi:hypothetical protein